MLQIQVGRRYDVEPRNELSGKLVKPVRPLFKIKNYQNTQIKNQLSWRKPEQKVELQTGRVLNMLSE